MIPTLFPSEFLSKLEQKVAQTVCDEIDRHLPMTATEARVVCFRYGIQCRFDVTKCGQDIDFARINFTTKDGIVTNVRCG